MIRSLLCLLVTVAVALPCQSAEEGFSLAEGLQVSAAVEPGLVNHPFGAALDDRGRLFVFDKASINSDEEGPSDHPSAYSIQLLVDSNADGVFDQATRFADYVDLPRGAVWIYDSLYVISPPGLWKFTDLNGDGVAEEREILVSGFDSLKSANRLVGPFLHPNGRLYWAHRNGGYEISEPETGETLEAGEGIRIWFTDIGGSEIETFAKGGIDEVVAMDFTEEGEILATTGRARNAPPFNALIHWIYQGSYSREKAALSPEDVGRGVDLLPALHDFGTRVGSSLRRYRSGTLDPDWENQWLSIQFGRNQLTRTRIRREGASFIAAEPEEIFRVENPNALLTGVLEDHNGDLLVFDSGGRDRIGLPITPGENFESTGTIYRISKAETSFKAIAYPEWESMTSEAVSEFLDVEEFWLRDQAGLELAGRGDPAIPELKRILRSPESSALAKRNAIWVLAKLQFSETTDLILEALQDDEAGVRQAAAHAMSVTRTWQSIAANEPAEMTIELERNRIISGTLASMVRSDKPRVAREAATALGRMAEFRAIGALLGRLTRVGEDLFLEHAIVHALVEIDDAESTAIGLESTEPGTIRGVLRALSEMPSGKLEVLHILPHLDAEEERLRQTAAELAILHPEWDAALANRFFEWDDYTPGRLETMRTVVGAFASHPPVLDFLTSLVTHENPQRQMLGLQLALQAENLEIPAAWYPHISSFLTDPTAETLRTLSLRLLHSFPGAAFPTELSSLVTDSSLPPETRFRAFLALPERSEIKDEFFALLIEALQDSTTAKTRALALEILASFRVTAEQRFEIVEAAASLSSEEAPLLLEIFREMQTEKEALALASYLLAFPDLAGFDLIRLEKLFSSFPNALGKDLQSKIDRERQRSWPAL